MSVIQTEFYFELPKGYIDGEGNLHKKGTMRLATAGDEIIPLKDPRVQQNPSYLSIVILARVITKLGDLAAVDTMVIEKLFAGDIAFLQDMYQRINDIEPPVIESVCPHCGEKVKVPYTFLGE